jgi:AcrR family transcriptional regulator
VPSQPERSRLKLRERKKARTRDAIQSQALRLFRDQGYEATAVSQIAEAAEVSESTFFRYFPTKEDVVMWDRFDPLILDAVRLQPAGSGPIVALRGAFRDVLGRPSGPVESQTTLPCAHLWERSWGCVCRPCSWCWTIRQRTSSSCSIRPWRSSRRVFRCRREASPVCRCARLDMPSRSYSPARSWVGAASCCAIAASPATGSASHSRYPR